MAFRATWFSCFQIRMHALHLGHPVLGDSLYGTEEGKRKSDRLLLHARKISFPHVRHKTTNPWVVRLSREFDQPLQSSVWWLPPLRNDAVYSPAAFQFHGKTVYSVKALGGLSKCVAAHVAECCLVFSMLQCST